MATKKPSKTSYEREMQKRRREESALADKYYGKNIKKSSKGK